VGLRRRRGIFAGLSLGRMAGMITKPRYAAPPQKGAATPRTFTHNKETDTYKPPQPQPLREGAEAHKKFLSRGTKT
jgi:hypothetical protein